MTDELCKTSYKNLDQIMSGVRFCYIHCGNGGESHACNGQHRPDASLFLP